MPTLKKQMKWKKYEVNPTGILAHAGAKSLRGVS